MVRTAGLHTTPGRVTAVAAGVVGMLLGASCGAPDEAVAPEPTTAPSGGTTPAPSPEATDAPVGERDARTWPYPSDSIWNHPLGDEASLVPFPVEPSDVTLVPEEDLLIIAPEAPLQDVYATTAGWDPAQTRCGSVTDEVLVEDLPIPEDWTTDPGYDGATPNQSTAILLPDDTLLELQPFHVCPDGTPVAQYAAPAWRGSSIITGGVAGDIGGGSHGGSGLTAFGGTIRLGEWVPGGRIRHALKVTVSGDELSGSEGGFRWPADRADVDWATTYLGSVPEARMGALLALATDFDVDELATEPARIIATALQEYGAYVVDDAGRRTVAYSVEWGPQGRVTDEFEQTWGYPMAGRVQETSGDQQSFLADMERIDLALHVVDDNSAETIGGAGSALAPFAPPLAVS
ncbi:hypothetical protein [Nocardioides sp.]|uniref:hypothetical protein n=1 Tax=Nocardioides sp. TaxID=35761 RepID=UPI002603C787|nr:hypothetical protein [Nocardioides sp.]